VRVRVRVKRRPSPSPQNLTETWIESREKSLKDEAIEIVEIVIKRHKDFHKAIKTRVRFIYLFVKFNLLNFIVLRK